MEIFVKMNSKYPQRDITKIVNFHFSHYKSMGTKSCHSNQSSYPIGTKKQFFVPLPIDAICVNGNNWLNGFRGDVV